MSEFPLAQTVGHKPYTGTGENSHGNEVKTYGDVVDVKVYGYGPPTRSTDAEPGGTQVIEGLDVYAPAPLLKDTPDGPVPVTVDPRDLFVVDGKEFMVIGEVSDWTKGPFGFMPGQVIHLKRVEGGR